MPPACVKIKRLMVERVALYQRVPPLEENITVKIDPFLVNDSVQLEEEV